MGTTRARLLVLLCAAAAGVAGTANADLLPVDTAILEEAIPEGWVWDDFTTGYLAPALGIETVDPVLTEYSLPPELAVPHGISKEPGNTSATQSSRPNLWFSTLGNEITGTAAPHVVRLDPQTGELKVFTVPGPYFGVPDLFVQPNKIVWGQATMAGEDFGDLFFVDPATGAGKIYDTDLRFPDQMFIDQQGNVWGVEFDPDANEGQGASRIWVFNQKAGQLFRWDVTQGGLLPRSIVRRRNGDVWFTFRFPVEGQDVVQIGRLNPKTNAFTFYSAGTTNVFGFSRIETIRADPNDAMGAPEGRLWVTPGFAFGGPVPDAIGVLDPAALTFTRYNLPPLSSDGDPYGLAMGCAGSVAFGENNIGARKLGLLVPGQSTSDGTEASIPTPAVITPTPSTPPATEVDFTTTTQQATPNTIPVTGTVFDGIAEFETNSGGDEGPHLTVMGPNERIVATLPNRLTGTDPPPAGYRIALLELPPEMRCNKVS